MLYMVEMNFLDEAKVPAWGEYYAGHMRHLLSLPGFLSAQRFRSVDPDQAFLAMYGIESAGTMTSDEYRQSAGPTSARDWSPYFANWRRDIFSGVDAMSVEPSERLLVFDRRGEEGASAAQGLSEAPNAARLAPAGLDGSTKERVIRVVKEGWRQDAIGAVPSGWEMREFRPLTEQVKRPRA